MDWEEKFAERLTALRMEKGVSARDMSLSIGQSAGYINNIENKNNLPSMSVFFYICEYLNITPMEFFDIEAENPGKLNEITADLKKLTPEKLDSISELIRYLK
ncbi:MAG: helix-turn-helix domain-containing protein [Candidatus Ornithomonoglobus sp.]